MYSDIIILMFSRKNYKHLFGFEVLGRQKKIFKDRLCPELYPSIMTVKRSCCSQSKTQVNPKYPIFVISWIVVDVHFPFIICDFASSHSQDILMQLS